MISCECHRPLEAAGAHSNQASLTRQQGKITSEHRCDVSGRENAPASETSHNPIQQQDARESVG